MAHRVLLFMTVVFVLSAKSLRRTAKNFYNAMFEKIAKQQKCLLQEHHAGLLSPIGTILEDI